MNGRSKSTARIEAANMMNIDCHDMLSRSKTATMGPTICPADPAAVAIARLIARCSGALARPTTARMTPKPVPAIPKPTRISYN